MKKHLLVSLSMLTLCAGALSAQSPVQQQLDSLKASHKVVTFGEGEVNNDSIRKMIDEFYYDQFRNSQEPDAPYFIFMSKNSNLAMGIGGSLRARGWYNWGGYVPTSGFVTSAIPIPSDPANSRALRGNVSGSRLYFKVLGNNKKIGHYQVYMEAKFSGYNGRGFQLSKAYATLGDWTLGYATSTFADPAAQPYTVDMQGPNSAISDTDILLRWMHTFKGHNVVAASLEMPNADDVTATPAYGDSHAWLPNVSAFYQYQWDEGQHIRLSGIMRFLSYRDLVASQNKTQLGWGVKASTIFRPYTGPVTIYLDGLYGKGISSITNDLGGLNLDLLGDPANQGKMYAPAVFGCTGGVQYNFSPSVFATAAVSELRFLPGHAVDNSTYRYGLYGAFNLCWYITPRVFVGAEVDLGALKNFGGEKEWAHRAGVIAQFNF